MPFMGRVRPDTPHEVFHAKMRNKKESFHDPGFMRGQKERDGLPPAPSEPGPGGAGRPPDHGRGKSHLDDPLFRPAVHRARRRPPAVGDAPVSGRAGSAVFCGVSASGSRPGAHRAPELLVLYRWDRIYPADQRLDLDLARDFRLVSVQDFAGHAHEIITKEVYQR